MSEAADEPTSEAAEPVPFSVAARTWCRVAALSFGGPAGQIAVMHRIIVEEKKWIGEERFLHALNYCTLLPGPEAQQLATYIGWLMHGTRGGLTAGTLFILPGFLAILVLSILYAEFQQTALLTAVFFGLKPAVASIVIEAVIRIGRRVIKNRVMLGLAAASFVAIFFGGVPFPAIVAAAAMMGLVGTRFWPETFAAAKKTTGESITSPTTGNSRGRLLRRSLLVSAVCLTLWFGPILALGYWFGVDSVFVQEGLFFSV